MADVTLHPWTEDDLPVLQRSNTPEMMVHLGGPETERQLIARHAKYILLNARGEAHMFTIRVEGEAEPVGTMGYWRADWDGPAYEAGWSVATPYQGRGYARTALAALLEDAAAQREPGRDAVYADPAVDNEASNRLCRSLGFEDRGERDVTYSGRNMRVNVWAFDLARLR